MAHAFVFVDCAAGRAEGVVEATREYESIESAHVVAGDFDVVVEVGGEAVRDLLRTVTSEIRPLDGVGATKTYVSLE